MASTRIIKSRIRSVKNTRQITKAMELVAASKMRRATAASRASELYARSAAELLSYLSSQRATDLHPLYAQRRIKTRLLIVITSNKGLAGAYNSNVMRRYGAELEADDAAGVANQTIAIGSKGSSFVTRIKQVEVAGVYDRMSESITGGEVKPIVTSIIDLFLKRKIDAVDMIYTRFMSSITQVVAMTRLLPAGFSAVDVGQNIKTASFEPSEDAVLQGATVRLIETQLFQALLDGQASEQSMRMMAMQNASKNAGDLISDLTLEMNKLRQAGITQDLAEISGGVEAMSAT